MSYTDLRDFDPELIAYFETDDHDVIEVSIEKLGGGRVGAYYEGTWRYIIENTNRGVELARGQDFQTAVKITHQRAAEIIFEMMNNREG